MRGIGLTIGTLVLAAVGCGRAGGAGAAGVTVPQGLVASGPTDYVDYVQLDWGAVIGAAHYELQGRIGAAAWETINDQIPGDIIGGQLSFSTDAPEAIQYAFRIRAVGAQTSGWSNEATIFRGVRASPSLTAYDLGNSQGPVAVTWTQGSTQADAILLERALVALDGSTGAWSALPGVALGNTSYSDTDTGSWLDGARLSYRVTYWKNGYSSAPASNATGPAKPLAPIALQAAPAGTAAIQLTWTPRSAYADRLVVMRWARTAPGSEVDVATLPSTASSYADAVPSPGAYLYAVRSQVGGVANIVNYVGQSEQVLGVTALDPSASFTASAPSLPPGSQVARDSVGRFGTVEWTTNTANEDVARAHLPDDGGWATYDDTLADRGLQTPGILFDPQDQPHLFMVEFIPGVLADQPRHDWRDASGWHSELLPPYRTSDVTIDAAGAIHAVSCETALVYMTNASGSWTAETLTAPYVNESCRVAVGPDGDPRIAWGTYQSTPTGQVYQLSSIRRESGTWVTEAIPGTDGVIMDWWLFYRVLAPSATRTAVVYEQSSVSNGSTLYAVVRDGGVWGPVEQIGTRPQNGQQESYAAAADPSGRLLVAWNGWLNGCCGAAGEAALRAAGGGWTTFTLLDAPYSVAAGFSPNGKAWVLEGLGSGMPEDLLYTEK